MARMLKDGEGRVYQEVNQEGTKPGWKTTEFWAALAPQVAGALALAGVLTPAQADAYTQVAIQVVGLVAMVLSSMGYSTSRGKAKGK